MFEGGGLIYKKNPYKNEGKTWGDLIFRDT